MCYCVCVAMSSCGTLVFIILNTKTVLMASVNVSMDLHPSISSYCTGPQFLCRFFSPPIASTLFRNWSWSRCRIIWSDHWNIGIGRLLQLLHHVYIPACVLPHSCCCNNLETKNIMLKNHPRECTPVACSKQGLTRKRIRASRKGGPLREERQSIYDFQSIRLIDLESNNQE